MISARFRIHLPTGGDNLVGVVLAYRSWPWPLGLCCRGLSLELRSGWPRSASYFRGRCRRHRRELLLLPTAPERRARRLARGAECFGWLLWCRDKAPGSAPANRRPAHPAELG